MLSEIQSASSRIWTRVTVSISYDDNHYTTVTSSAILINRTKDHDSNFQVFHIYVYLGFYTFNFKICLIFESREHDIAILENTPNQAETLLHSLERAAEVTGLHVNARKTEYMYYNQTGDISTLHGTSLKLVDKFTYLGSSVSSTEKDIDTRLTKKWTTIDWL